MRIDNTLDEVVFAATLGLVPDTADLDHVTVPAGVDPAKFRNDLQATAKRIAALHNQGRHADARTAAAEASDAYLDAFDHPTPAPAGSTTSAESIEDIGRRVRNGGDTTTLDALGARINRR